LGLAFDTAAVRLAVARGFAAVALAAGFARDAGEVRDDGFFATAFVVVAFFAAAGFAPERPVKFTTGSFDLRAVAVAFFAGVRFVVICFALCSSMACLPVVRFVAPDRVVRPVVAFFLGAVVVVMNTELRTAVDLYVGDVLVIEDEIDNEPFPIYDVGARMWNEIKKYPGQSWRVVFGLGDNEEFNPDSLPDMEVEWSSEHEPLTDKIRFIGGVIDKYIELHTAYEQEHH
jgi:hypothetical protein